MSIRFTIKGLIIATTLVAIGFAGFLYPNPVLSSVVFTATVLIILCGMPAAICGHGPVRAYWIGFTVCGAGFLYLATLDENRDLQPAVHVPREPSLFTTQLLWRINGHSPSWRPRTESSTAAAEGVIRIGDRLFSARDEDENFVRIGNAEFALLLAFLGGAIGRRCHDDSRQNGSAIGGSVNP